ncbi:hypothetical protein K439DRAFT_1390595 [Ramaria rubella]|nr:hypothetical protein K439DRAFT_1390595 [Ramaria rubella]
MTSQGLMTPLITALIRHLSLPLTTTMTSYPVTVSNISPNTSETNLKDFFTFCGKIISIEHNPTAQTATIHFEKSSAAKTALMLNGGALDGAHLTVASETVHADAPDHHDEHRTDGAPIDQSDKPRAGIAAEYLARGYTLSDSVLQRAIDIDTKQGISKRFVSYLQSLDSTLGSRVVGPEKTISGKVQETLGEAQSKAKEVDEQKGISKTASDYYTKALAHPLGQKVFAFYTSTTKQVRDIHEEARRIADHHKNTSDGATSILSEKVPATDVPGGANPGASTK